MATSTRQTAIDRARGAIAGARAATAWRVAAQRLASSKLSGNSKYENGLHMMGPGRFGSDARSASFRPPDPPAINMVPDVIVTTDIIGRTCQDLASYLRLIAPLIALHFASLDRFCRVVKGRRVEKIANLTEYLTPRARPLLLSSTRDQNNGSVPAGSKPPVGHSGRSVAGLGDGRRMMGTDASSDPIRFEILVFRLSQRLPPQRAVCPVLPVTVAGSHCPIAWLGWGILPFANRGG